MDTLDAMKVFVRVAEAGSFAEAARQLDLAPASATRAVQSLEERVGFRLLHRTTRRIALTESGGRYMEAVKKALVEIGGLEEALRGEVSAEVRGTLRLTMPVALGVRHIVPLLAEFKRAHPRLRMDLDFSDAVVDLLGDGYDAAIRVSTRLADSSLSARRIGSSPLVISASPDYLRRHGVPRHLSELARHQRLDYLQQPAESVVPPGRAAFDVPADIRVNNGDALKAFALAGMGLIQTPAFVVSDNLANGRLVRVLPEERLGEYQISVVFPERAFMPLRTRRLIEYLAANLSDLGAPACPDSGDGEVPHRLAA